MKALFICVPFGPSFAKLEHFVSGLLNFRARNVLFHRQTANNLSHGSLVPFKPKQCAVVIRIKKQVTIKNVFANT